MIIDTSAIIAILRDEKTRRLMLGRSQTRQTGA